MNYSWFNRQDLLQKVKDKYHNCEGKQKAAEYYLANKEITKEKARKKSVKRRKRSKERISKR